MISGGPMRRAAFACVTLSAVLAALAALAGAQPPTTADPLAAGRFFQQAVLPVLQSKCFSCHGDDPKKVRGELDVRSRAGLLKGGQSGKPALVPGHPERSPLFIAVSRTNPDLGMPPKD